MFRYIFCFTEGRTGTAFLTQNCLINSDKFTAVHEDLSFEGYGLKFPTVSIMREYNELGFTPSVSSFFNRKLTSIQALGVPYFEANHTLAKCGLIEALSQENFEDTLVIRLRRRPVDLIHSLYVRNDLGSLATRWQFYLDFSYQRNRLDVRRFERLGLFAPYFWYLYEMERRWQDFKSSFPQMNFTEVFLEDLIDHDGLNMFSEEFFGFSAHRYPGKMNANKVGNDAIKDRIENTIISVDFRSLLSLVR